jgi:hypothetical protein
MFAAIRMFILNSMMPTSGVTKPEETTRFLQKPGNQSGPVNPVRFHRTTGFSRGKNKPVYCSKRFPAGFPGLPTGFGETRLSGYTDFVTPGRK